MDPYQDDSNIVAGDLEIEEGLFVNEAAYFSMGASFGSAPLVIDSTGALTTGQSVSVGNLVVTNGSSLGGSLFVGGDITAFGNKIIAGGKIPALTYEYIEDLGGGAITGVNAERLNNVPASGFLRSDVGDTAYGVLTFNSVPGSVDVSGGPMYINPPSASINYTLFGVAVNGVPKFKVDAEGDVQIEGTITLEDIAYTFPTTQSNNGLLQTDGSGSLTWATLGPTNVTPDSLDFTEFVDDMTLDNNLTISPSASNYSFNFDSGLLYLDSANDRVGIGTTAPGYALDVVGDIGIASGSDLYIGAIGLNDTAGATTSGAYLVGVFDEFDNSNSTNVQAVLDDLDNAIIGGASGDITAVGNILANEAFTTGTPGGELYFTDDGYLGLGVAKGRIIFDDDTTDDISFIDANVGIGTTAPSVALDVTGAGTFSDTLTANGAFDANGAVTLGDDGDSVAIDSSVWDITEAGVGSGFTSFTIDNVIIDGTTIGHTSDSDLLSLASGALTVNGTGTFTGVLATQATALGINNDADSDNLIGVGATAPGVATGNLYWGNDLICDPSLTDCGWTTVASSFTSWTVADDDADTYSIVSGNILAFTSSDNNILTNLADGDDGDETMDFSVRLLGDAVAGDGLTGGANDVLVGADGDTIFAVSAGDGIDVAASVAVDVTDILGVGLTESSNNIDVDLTYDFAWTGQHSFTNTLTATGSQADFNLTLGNDADVDTISAVNVDVTSASTGDADNVRGINIANLTSADGTVNEDAIYVGTGWDSILNVSGTDVIDGTGQLISSQLTGTLFSTAADAGSNTVEQGDTFTVNGGGISTTSLSGDTLTITSTEAQNIFTTIATTSGTSPVADTLTDTLTLTAGGNITITGDSGADSVTIAATGLDNYNDWDWYMNGSKQKDITSGATAGIDEGTAIDLTYNDTRDISIAFDSTELGTTTWYNGTAATDIIWTFNGETNDGTFGFYEDEDAFAFTNGSLGIGTTDPSQQLHLTGDLLIAGDDLFMGTNTANYFLMADGTNYNPVTPAAARTGLGLVAGGAGDIWVEKAGGMMTGDLTFNKADGSIIFDTVTATDTDFWLGVTDDAGTDDDDIFSIGDGATPGTNPFLSIDTSGNVGIGTTNPGAKLEVAGKVVITGAAENQLSIIAPVGESASIYIDSTASLGSSQYVFNRASTARGAWNIAQVNEVTDWVWGASLYNGGSASTSWGISSTTNLADAMFILDSSGNVGIGTTNPGTLLDVAGTFSVDGNSTIGDASGDTITFNAAVWTLANATTMDLATSTTALNIESGLFNLDTSNSYVGIGTTAPNSALEVVGNIDASGIFQAGSGNEVLTLSSGKIDADAITLLSSEGAGATASDSGLEALTDGLGLIQGCSDNEVLAWDDTGAEWECRTRSGTYISEFNPAGDGVTDDSTPFANAITAAKAHPNKRLILEDKDYYIPGGVDISGLTIEANNARLISDATDNVLEAHGSIGTYYVLSVDATKGDSWIKTTNATLGAGLAKGDLVKIRSDAMFAPLSGENVPQGEMHMVHHVSESAGTYTIYFNDFLFDTYDTDDNVEAAEVTPTSVNIEGLITLKQNTTSPDASGIWVEYGLQSKIRVLCESADKRCIYVKDSYMPYIEGYTHDTPQAGLGYGVVLANATMYAHVEGRLLGARHAITTGGNSSGGVVWEAVVEGVVGSQLTASGTFDTHSSSGSVYFNNCSAVGGILNDESTSTAVAFAMEGRYNYINNAFVEGGGTGVTASEKESRKLYVNGITCQGVSGVCVFVNTDNEVDDLVVRNLTDRDDTTDDSSTAIHISGSVGRWTFDNISAENKGILTINSTGTKPANITLANSSTEYDTASDHEAVVIGNDMDTVRLVNVSQNRAGALFHSTSTTAIESIEIINSTSLNANFTHIRIDGAATTVNIQGGYYGDLRTSDGEALVRIDNGNSVANMTISPTRTNGTNLTRAIHGDNATETVSTVMFGGDMTGITSKWNNLANTPVIVAAGTLGDKYITFDSSGNVGIGTTAPGLALDVVGSARFSAVGSGTYNADLNITSDGTLTTASSDISLKENLEAISDPLSKVMQLTAYSFNWIDDAARRDIGLVAQEVAEVIPEITFTNPVDGLMGINYSRLPVVLIGAMQEQQGQILDARSQIVDVESQLLDSNSLITLNTDEISLNSQLIQELTLQDQVLLDSGLSGDESGGGLFDTTEQMDEYLETYLAEYVELNNDDEYLAELEERIAFLEQTMSDTVQKGQAFLDENGEPVIDTSDDTGAGADTDSLTDLMVLGTSTLGDTTITGSFNVGAINIDGLTNGIDAIGTLHLQPSNLAGIDFMDGLIEFEQDGDIMIHTGDVAIKEGVIRGNDQMRGVVVVSAGSNTVEIDIAWEDEPQTIVVTPRFDTNVWTSDRSMDGFVINISDVSSQNQEVDWFAIW